MLEATPSQWKNLCSDSVLRRKPRISSTVQSMLSDISLNPRGKKLLFSIAVTDLRGRPIKNRIVDEDAFSTLRRRRLDSEPPEDQEHNKLLELVKPFPFAKP